MSVLMPLSQPAWAGNFCSNLLSPFLFTAHIISSQAISFHILIYARFSQFLWSNFLPFSSCFNFHNLSYLGIGVSTHSMTIPPQTALNYSILNLHNNTRPITKNISRHPINQSHSSDHANHTMLHPMEPRLISNRNFPRQVQ